VGQEPSEPERPVAHATGVLARRLVSRVAAPSGDATAGALATHAACERAYRELSRSLGQAGAAEIVSRAIGIARVQHPVLEKILIGRQSTPDTEAVTAAIQADGAARVTAALEAMLETMLRLLGRLVGDDLVSRLVEPTLANEMDDARDGKR
jgi:hypothetical protein